MMRNWYILVIILLAGCSLATKVPPVANAGPDVTIHIGQPILLDGSLSYDPDGGRIVNYDWQIVGVPKRRKERLEERLEEWLVEGNGEPVWTSPWVAAKRDRGQWIMRLQATDDEGDIATDDVVVTIIQ